MASQNDRQPINLDDMDPEELDAYAQDTTNDKTARNYAFCAAIAKRKRLAGDIDAALTWERVADMHYRELPA